ncbi:MAG: NAD-dependent epimerase/dehydratase family protein [Aliarcobacter sp.]|nr:NAD-dependent epimerase/dehydratase family protein [Aliarcobacter sp.]
MSNILVTGSKGFIGKNLLNCAKNDKSIHILEFSRNDTIEKLKDLISQCDFIIHLAGEVRPNSSIEDFTNSNIFLTKSILNILEEQNKIVPILLASSIHAKLLKNEYGKTKRESEILIEQYSEKNQINCFIYTLPHLFGEGCKENYNSGMSTWIYNSINNLEINVFDRNIQMNYSYVQDIVNEFLLSLKIKNSTQLYFEPNIIYNTTLGEVADFIHEFKLNILNENYKIKNHVFKEKLFETYKDYYRNLSVK